MDSTTGADWDARTRIRQQQIVAELGQRALESDDIDQLMHDASLAVSATLDTDYANVLELLPAGDEAVLRHGVGWRDGLAGNATVPAGEGSQADYTLRAEAPIVVDDLGTETRFSGSDLLTDHGVVSGISAPIGSGTGPWGVLGTYATERRGFSRRDTNFVRDIANVLATAIENETAQSRLSAVHERIANGVFALDTEWRFTHVNQRAETLLGYETEELVGSNLWETFPELTGSEFEERYREALETQEPVSFDGYYPPFDAWFEEHVYPSETGLSVYFRDVTEQKEMETELNEVYGRISDAFFALDENWEFTYLNERAHEFINPENRELLGEYVWDEFPEGTERKFKPEYERAMYEQETVSFEEYYPDPLNAWFEVRAYPSETGLSVYFRDVTDRKEREQELDETVHELRESEERLRLALRAGEMGTWELDLQTEESPIRSAKHDRIFGYEHPLEDWSFETFLEHVHPDDRDEVARRFEAAFETGRWEFECRITRADGEQRVIAAQGEFYYDSDDEPTRAVGVVRDVTDRHERERKLKESNERLEQFAHAASHDLQEPLRMVSSYLRLIESRADDELTEETEEFLQFAVDGADRMRTMIDGLLEYSRIESRGEPFEPVDLNVVLEDVGDDLRMRIEENDAEITVENLPRVEGDPSQLRQLFQNLVDNAIEYSGDESPRVHVGAARNGGDWVLSVRDEGIGIDPDHADRIFQMFERLHGSDEYDGTGIGLALCERIVERHGGGGVRIESEPGEGSSFSFTLPAASSDKT